jgi:hypothetical protein
LNVITPLRSCMAGSFSVEEYAALFMILTRAGEEGFR